jgi:hypothetical protein
MLLSKGRAIYLYVTYGIKLVFIYLLRSKRESYCIVKFIVSLTTVSANGLRLTYADRLGFSL